MNFRNILLLLVVILLVSAPVMANSKSLRSSASSMVDTKACFPKEAYCSLDTDCCPGLKCKGVKTVYYRV